MLERREGINPERAAQLEALLERQFEVAGLGKAEVHQGLTALEIIERGLREHPIPTLANVLDGYFQARAVDSQLRVHIALICGELFGTGDLSSIESRLDKTSSQRKKRTLKNIESQTRRLTSYSSGCLDRKERLFLTKFAKCPKSVIIFFVLPKKI